MSPEDAGQPGEPPAVSLLSHGYQYLTEQRYDQMEPVLEIIRRDVLALGLPLRSIEVEFGPSQCEFTFAPTTGLDARRQHGAVSQRREADRASPRLSRHLHVPAETAERVRLRLASASVAGLARERRERLHGEATSDEVLSPFGRALSRRAAGSMRAPRPCSRRRPSTATSATAPIRWRRTARSGAATTAA